MTPGPFSFYRRSVLETLGGFRYGHQTEDMEMALRMQAAGYEIENTSRARVYTKAPRTVPTLIRQRVRWTTGFIRNMFGEYRGLVFSPRHGALGMMILPIALLAIVSGVALFVLSILQFIFHTATAIQVRAGIPLSYTFAPRYTGLDWFYLPTDVLALLGVAMLFVSCGLIAYGKYLSKTNINLRIGLVSYLFYGLVAPLWLLRATADVAFGKSRSWR